MTLSHFPFPIFHKSLQYLRSTVRIRLAEETFRSFRASRTTATCPSSTSRRAPSCSRDSRPWRPSPATSPTLSAASSGTSGTGAIQCCREIHRSDVIFLVSFLCTALFILSVAMFCYGCLLLLGQYIGTIMVHQPREFIKASSLKPCERVDE